MSEPIIQSLLDLDLYKLTMLQFIWRRHRDVPVTFTLRNRTSSVRLGSIVQFPDLREELGRVRQLRFRDDEIAYLATLKLFDPAFLAWLRDEFRLSEIAMGVRGDGQLEVEATGPWALTTLWETIVLSIVNELYYLEVMLRESLVSTMGPLFTAGRRRLDAKIARIRGDEARRLDAADAPDPSWSTPSNVIVVEFGTRRRFSRDWQRAVVAHLRERIPQNLAGTSNVLLAKELGLKPIGTFAHELDMVYSGIYRDVLRGSHQRVLEDWWNEYGEPLSVALTDTYTSDFFFEDMTAEQAQAWRGLRQDSGDPFAFADQAIAFYERHGVDPKTKTIIFSDGLDVEAILRIADHCRGRIGYAFGWGTNLTNDLGFPALSLVMKVTRAAGHGTVKLSDNLAKAQGTPEDVALFTKTFGHAPTTREECRY